MYGFLKMKNQKKNLRGG